MQLINNVFYQLVDVVLPPRCASCDVHLIQDAGLCSKCWSGIHFISGVMCYKCGYPMEFDLQEDQKNVLCGRCFTKSIKYEFEYARSVCSYGGIAKKIVSRFKYNDNLHIANYLAKSMLVCFLENFKNCNIICPVPIHSKSLRQRTFNQSALIILAFIKLLKKSDINIRYIPDLLCKTKLTARQNTLSRDQRLQNVKNSFCLNDKYDIKNQKIIILDDVITTGATINECSKTIKKNVKSAKIYAISYARTTLSDFFAEDENF